VINFERKQKSTEPERIARRRKGSEEQKKRGRRR